MPRGAEIERNNLRDVIDELGKEVSELLDFSLKHSNIGDDSLAEVLSDISSELQKIIVDNRVQRIKLKESEYRFLEKYNLLECIIYPVINKEELYQESLKKEQNNGK